MDYLEYPKALYRKGIYIAVANAGEEETARADGYDDWAADYAAYGIPAEPTAAGTTAEPEPAPESAPEPAPNKPARKGK